MKQVILTERCDDISYSWNKKLLKYECYLLKELPKEESYFDLGKHKGYVVSIQEEEILEKGYKMYTLYYEDNLGDYYNDVIDITHTCNIAIVE